MFWLTVAFKRRRSNTTLEWFVHYDESVGRTLMSIIKSQVRTWTWILGQIYIWYTYKMVQILFDIIPVCLFLFLYILIFNIIPSRFEISFQVNAQKKRYTRCKIWQNTKMLYKQRWKVLFVFTSSCIQQKRRDCFCDTP